VTGLLHGTDSSVGDLGDRAFEWIRQRLASSPVGVIGDKPALDAALAGSINDAGLGLDGAWQHFEEVVAPNNIGLDSERFLAFIPLSPSVASVWMDTIVSAANFSAESWLEGAGAVAAENQVIDLLCRAAEMPPGAAGCFMSGGSIGNLSALAVGRDRAGGRRSVAVADTAHASVDNALHLLGLEPLVVPTGPDCRLTGDALRTAIGDRRDVGIIVAAGGSTNAGVIDDLDAPTGWPRSCCRSCVTGSPAWGAPTRSSSIPTSGCSPRPGRVHSCTASRRWHDRCTHSTGRTSTCCAPATTPTTRAIWATN
jgi:hypothetical protein